MELFREDLIITEADKGGVIVIWGIKEYLKETNNQLNNKEFNHKLLSDLFEDHQDTIINSLNDIWSKKNLTKKHQRYNCYKVMQNMSASVTKTI